MRRYTSESTFITTRVNRVVCELRLMESRVNDIPGRGQVDVSPLVRFFQGSSPLPLMHLDPPQYWSEGRATPTFRTFREGVRVLGAAWWMSPRGFLHMRVIGARLFAANVNALKVAVRPWGLSDRQMMRSHDAAFVYPALWVPCPSARSPGVLNEMRRHLTIDPFDCVTWCAMADWLEDGGLTDEAQQARLGGMSARWLASGDFDEESEPERTGEE